jgi:hypothetical protein
MSTLNVANITDGTDTVETGYVVNGSAKAWVNMRGTGTVAIRDSLNVSSTTDIGTGRYSVNFSSNLANTNYAATGAIPYATWGASVQADFYAKADSASFMELTIVLPYSNFYDGTIVYAAAFGDLA